MRDELSHVAYTAQLIEEKAAETGLDQVKALFVTRLSDFNDITRTELGDKVFD
jgi:hypothetical protein